MKRRLSLSLDAWARKPSRKPLVLRGARQVGKSHLLRTWGRERFGAVAEVNLERDPQLAQAFRGNDPKATLRRLEALTGQVIRPDSSNLLFIDEIQAVPEVLGKLRWFAEELPALPVAAAGSLLDFALAEPTFSMPVGRITFMHLEPMGFEEFLEAQGEAALLRQLHELELPKGDLLPAVHEKLLDLFRTWLLVGGMPAAVATWLDTGQLSAVRELHRDLLATVRADFAKYSSRAHHHRLTAVFDSVPRQLGNKFSYAGVDRHERARDLSIAVELLCLARVCHRVQASPATGTPLAAGIDPKRFKLISMDIGLVCSALRVEVPELEARDLTLANEGALAEQVVGQLLRCTFSANEDPALYYWHRTERRSDAEVDYVTEHGARVIPVEVKAGKTGRLRSLHQLMALRRLKRAVRFNADLPSVTTAPGFELLSLPLYLVEQLPRLLG
jgi:predicted AAA+ superfamily ATPase